MGKKIAWTEPAKAHLRALDQPTALRILRAMARFLATGEGDIKRLQDVEPPELRLRVGDYRVRFHDLGDSILVLAEAPARCVSLTAGANYRASQRRPLGVAGLDLGRVGGGGSGFEASGFDGVGGGLVDGCGQHVQVGREGVFAA